ncbi:Lipk [Symbiodinium necroappetens]|uniref:Lipk protein n=1 Tax=Symbiodinium necroappetens TaxID=1628268 RepID=A0A813C415_9DINO|nr:Lipk [Symbiodinium necroappetens]
MAAACRAGDDAKGAATLERKEQQKVALFRPTLMENSYNALRAAPLVPGAQPPQAEGDQKSCVPRQPRWPRNSFKVTSAPAAALRLLENPLPGAPVGICRAPLIYRVQPNEGVALGSESCYIATSGTEVDSVSSPGDFWQGAPWHPQGPPQVQMPCLRLSEVLPGRSAGRDSAATRLPSHAEKPKIPGLRQRSGSENSTESGASGSAEGSAKSAVLGSPELPSRGSALHAWRACKPCAFVFQEGCQNKEQCDFCHLCEPGERKRRKKERRLAKREAREGETMP